MEGSRRAASWDVWACFLTHRQRDSDSRRGGTPDGSEDNRRRSRVGEVADLEHPQLLDECHFAMGAGADRFALLAPGNSRADGHDLAVGNKLPSDAKVGERDILAVNGQL